MYWKTSLGMDNFFNNLIWIFSTVNIDIFFAKWLRIVMSWLISNISDNQIEELPASVCNLSHLKSLFLDNNNVNQIPPNY
ncbi:hypothetical protein PIB30_030573 [Stylosanthes scabra]|uniref:Uncharacterized protein n=1 Tax=Stylosanthes scabra TaxID=79078 RepID=A0ABU6TBA6_9FABA|nr:hypothetical protein [Stylosanthes scabra]